MANKSSQSYHRNRYIELTVRQDAELMEFLMTEMHGISRNRVKDLLHGTAVRVDNQIITQYNFPVHPGQVIRISKYKKATDLKNKYIKILYEDHDLIVIEKAEGILSMASAPGQFCVKEVLDAYFQKRHFKCKAHVVHRLDRETSGLMIYAKTIDIQKVLESDWHNIVYDRRYVAVLSGEMEREGGTVHSWLKDNKAFITYSSDTDNGGREAITHYHTLSRKDGYSLVELRLETGRKNQIRVHMSDIGHPVAGDQKYGNGCNPIGRLALHAFRLRFYHPRTGEPMEFETPFPERFIRMFRMDKESSATI